MELQFEKSELGYMSAALCRTQTQEETTEVIVPDSYPDAQSVICTSAACVMRGKEVRAGSVVVSGAIRASALYAPEDGSWPRVLEAYLPFSVRFDDAAASESLRLIACCRVQQADARPVNSRKLLFRVSVGCTVTGYEEKSIALFALREKPEELRVRTQTYPLCLPQMAAEKSFVMTEDIELGAIEPEISQIVCYETIPEVTDRKIVGARAVFKGNVRLRLLYQTAEHTLAQLERRLPFSQYCDLARDADADTLSLCLCVTSSEITAVEDEREITLSLGLAAQCVVSGVRTAEVIDDAYAIGASFTPEWCRSEPCCILDTQMQTQQLRHRIELEDAAEIVFYTIAAAAPACEHQNGSAAVTVPVYINILYRTTDGTLRCAHERAQVSYAAALAQQAQCSASATIREAAIGLVSGGAEVHAEVQLAPIFTAAQPLVTLCGGTIEQEEDTQQTQPAVILRMCSSGMPLWDLAKRYATAAEAIAGANHLSGDTVPEDMLLLIPM